LTAKNRPLLRRHIGYAPRMLFIPGLVRDSPLINREFGDESPVYSFKSAQLRAYIVCHIVA
jgi:hypothetical protein